MARMPEPLCSHSQVGTGPCPGNGAWRSCGCPMCFSCAEPRTCLSALELLWHVPLPPRLVLWNRLNPGMVQTYTLPRDPGPCRQGDGWERTPCFTMGCFAVPQAPLACMWILKGGPLPSPFLTPPVMEGYKMSIYPGHQNDSSVVPLIW